MSVDNRWLCLGSEMDKAAFQLEEVARAAKVAATKDSFPPALYRDVERALMTATVKVPVIRYRNAHSKCALGAFTPCDSQLPGASGHSRSPPGRKRSGGGRTVAVDRREARIAPCAVNDVACDHDHRADRRSLLGPYDRCDARESRHDQQYGCCRLGSSAPLANSRRRLVLCQNPHSAACHWHCEARSSCTQCCRNHEHQVT